MSKKDLIGPLDVPPDCPDSFKDKMDKIFSSIYSQDDPELPLLPEKHRMFAFRWATEYRTNAEWARIFHVSDTRIAEWKRNPKILKYYLIIRQKQNMVLMERMKLLETKAFQKLYEILDMEVNAKNADVIRKTIMNVLGVNVDGALNLNVIAQAGASEEGSSRRIKPASGQNDEVLDIKRLREKLDEMELLEELVDVTPRIEEREEEDEQEESEGRTEGESSISESSESD